MEYNYIKRLERRQIHGDYLANWNLGKYCRYALVIPTVPRKDLSWQGLVGGDYYRTPVKFQVSDDLVFVGEYQNKVKQKISLVFWQHFPCTDPGRF